MANDDINIADQSGEIALCYMARAWIDRWQACGGHFTLSFNSDGSFRSVVRGVPEPNFWTPTDEGRTDLPPHTWLVEERHQRGAVKVLESLLEMVPGLQKAVFEIGGTACLASEEA